jgi:hypothetical protein
MLINISINGVRSINIKIVGYILILLCFRVEVFERCCSGLYAFFFDSLFRGLFFIVAVKVLLL